MSYLESGHFLIDQERIPFAIRRSKRRRRTISFTIDKSETICIAAPMRARFAEIEDLILRRSGWLSRRLDRIRRHRAEKRSLNEGVIFLGTSCALRITNDRQRPQGCTLRDNILEVNLPDAHEGNETQQEEARLEIMLWYKKQAKQIFKERADYWSGKLGLAYRSFAVSNPKRLWGSCSGRDDIRINWRLIMAPPILLDYVIVHELCHIRHKNHSARFWHAVEMAMPGCKHLRKQLRELDPGFICN